MMTASQLTRPFRWLATFKVRGQDDAAELAKGVTATHATAEVTTSAVQWVGNSLTLPRNVDASSYLEVIAAAKQMVGTGTSEVVVDMRYVEHIELSGLFALHCIALAMRGKPLPNPVDGWGALRSAVEQNRTAGRCEQVKLINSSAHITAKLQAHQLDCCMLIVP